MENLIILNNKKDNKNAIENIYDMDKLIYVDSSIILTQTTLISMVKEYARISSDEPVLFIDMLKITFIDTQSIITFLEKYVGGDYVMEDITKDMISLKNSYTARLAYEKLDGEVYLENGDMVVMVCLPDDIFVTVEDANGNEHLKEIKDLYIKKLQYDGLFRNMSKRDF